MLPRIFVGGTGRSGTWIVYRSLGSHADVHTFPAEMRFLIDPGGLLELLEALTTGYTPARARKALARFERLMKVYLATPNISPYAALDLPQWLGNDYYWNRLEQFCSALLQIEYNGFSWDVEYTNEGRLVDWARHLQEIRRNLLNEEKPPVVTENVTPTDVLRVGKYFSNRSTLINLMAEFVDDLFTHAAETHGKKTWCEKTPQHILHLDFIWELFPESAFIHVKRDPRGVAQSMVSQRWAPNNLKQVCILLKDMYEKWFDLKSKIDLSSKRYLEFRLEDIALAPDDMLNQVTQLCQLDNRFGDLPKISLDKVSYWKNEMSKQEIMLVNDILGHHIQQMGYDL